MTWHKSAFIEEKYFIYQFDNCNRIIYKLSLIQTLLSVPVDLFTDYTKKYSIY